jgi:hypothetical protein
LVPPLAAARGEYNLNDPGSDASGDFRRPHTRRVTDWTLLAFHQACDQSDLEVAEALLAVVEMMLRRPPGLHGIDRRRNVQALVAAHERLWSLRHPNT